MTAPAQLTFEEFCQRLLSLFDDGRFNATYKYGVLIGLLDLLSEQVAPGGELPDVLHTRELARAVLELYWPHTRAFPIQRFDENGKPLASAGRVLRQNNGGQAEVLSRIERFLESIGGDASAPASVGRSRAPERFEQLVRFVEFKLIEMPLGKLQFVGELHDPFIYDLDWDREHPPPLRVVRADGFDGVLRLRPGVAGHLLRAAALVRPLVQREWALAVSSFNDGLLGDDLDEFLFGTERVSLTPVRAGLRELAASRCFYCGRAAGDGAAQIDHFLPWTRHIDNGLANLVYAHSSCNNAKRAHLAAEEHLQRWVDQLRDATYGAGMTELAAERHWECVPVSSLSAARGIYLALHDGYPLWQTKRSFSPADHDQLEAILNVVV